MARRISMTEADHKIVTSAVARAEEHTDAEIVTIVARRSDAYHDVGLHWAILAMLLVPAFAAAFPRLYQDMLIWLAETGHVLSVPSTARAAAAWDERFRLGARTSESQPARSRLTHAGMKYRADLDIAAPEQSVGGYWRRVVLRAFPERSFRRATATFCRAERQKRG